MRLKSHGGRIGIPLAGQIFGGTQNRLMAAMNTIKVADRKNHSGRKILDFFFRFNHLHEILLDCLRLYGIVQSTDWQE
jgi:hypothetical protein